MGLFKDFKEDFSQAVDELLPGGENVASTEDTEEFVVDTLDESVDVQNELSKLDGLLEQTKAAPASNSGLAEELSAMSHTTARETAAPTKPETMKETRPMSENAATLGATNNAPISDETSVITASTVLTGDLQSSGSFDIQGTINGNITCNGKITVTGTINGNSTASEFFADVAKIEGEVVSTGTVKVGTGSVIIGNITATSAVIAGAIKGDIDVQGPVVVDTSAVIMGNIKSRSVQINNGAVIEGFCSQCYADIDVQGLFETK